MKTSVKKTAVITGASQGIGQAISKALAEDGADVILLGRSIEKLKSVASECSANDCSTDCLELNLENLDEIAAVSAHIGNNWPEIHVLINCAATYRSGAWHNSSVAVLDELYRTNVRGVFALTQALLPLLIKAAGDIVFINSSATHSNGLNIGQYAATKHALLALADSLRAEVNSEGVRVLSVFPGRTATPLQESIHLHEGKNYQPAALLQAVDIAQIVTACLRLAGTAEVTEFHIRPKWKTP